MNVRGAVDERQDRARGEAVVGVIAAARAAYETGRSEHGDVLRDSRLVQPEHVGQLADTGLARREPLDDAQPVLVREGAKHLRGARVITSGHVISIWQYGHIANKCVRVLEDWHGHRYS